MIRNTAAPWACRCGTAERRTAVLLVVGLAVIVGDHATGQSLNDAVNEQLKIASPPGGIEKACEVLLGDDKTFDVLKGKLADDICSRSIEQVSPTSAAAGGGQAIPASAPGIVQRLLRGPREEETTEVATTDRAASADAVAPITERLSLFAAPNYERLDRDRTTFEDGYDSHVAQATLGFDYQLQDGLVAGVAYDYLERDGSYQAPGDFEVTGHGVLGFAGWAPTDRLYFQVVGEYMRKTYDRDRFSAFAEESTEGTEVLSSGIVTANYGADFYQVGLGAGYRQPIGAVDLAPIASLEWTRIEYESYCEKGDTGLELCFEDDDQTSLISSLGLGVTGVVETEFGLLAPSASVEWKHEFDNDQRVIDVSFVDDTRRNKFSFQTEPPNRDFGMLRLGVVAILPSGIQAFAQVRTLFAHDFLDSHGGVAGIRYSF